ncbi:MAG: aminotransferase class V-fold PLP-dependent enzyme, partial [Pseudomonadota bacterium]
IDASGLPDFEALHQAIDEKTALVSVMAANNEIGTLAPLADIAALAHQHGALFHTDAAQAVGKIPIDVNAMGIDLLSFSAHKLYAPKGVGFLYVRQKPRIPMISQMDGGGQQGRFRSGTLAPALVVAMGKACALTRDRLSEDADHARQMRADFLECLDRAQVRYVINGTMEARLPGNLNLHFPGIDEARLLSGLRGIAVSSGAACASAAGEPSYVLEALGLAPDAIASSLRIGFGRGLSADQVEQAAAELARAVNTLRK